MLVLVLALLAGCTPPAEPPPPGPGEPTMLVFRHQRMIGTEPAIEALLGEFERAHPGVRVRDEVLPTASDAQHQLYVTNLEGGARDFDVLSVDVIWVPEFARAGWILDLSGRFPPERVRADFLAGPAEAATWGGRTWALPWFADAGLLYWRRDLLERHGIAPPRTWADLEAAARAVLDAERRPRLKGFVWQGRQYEGLVCCALEAIRGFGGGILGPDGRIRAAEPGTVRALAYLRRLVATGVSPALTTSADEEVCRTIFGDGDAVFMRNWPYALRLLEREGSPVRGRVGFGPLPAEPGATEPGGTLGGWQLAVNARTPAWKRALACDLVEHLTTAAAERRVLAAYGYYPPRRALYRDPDFRAAEPLAAALEPVLSSARPRPVTPYYLMLSEALAPELSAAVAGIRTPEAAMRRAEVSMRVALGDVR